MPEPECSHNVNLLLNVGSKISPLPMMQKGGRNVLPYFTSVIFFVVLNPFAVTV
jgi:hypothetical protein